MNKIVYPLLFLLALLIHPQTGQSQQHFNPRSALYLWPTEASSHLTSTFAETRSAHFHAAVDIKTWGQRGYKVYATRDGIVDRVAIGPRGYGKVVYLKHEDGSYSVYAHLLSFNKQLQQLVDDIRFENGYKFEMEKFWGWRNIKVQQGDVIGYSGASGIGPPHLHFELRTPSHKPFNPLLTNLSVTDTIAPQIAGIAIEPLSPSSSIEGNNTIFTRRAWKKNDHYELGTITVKGPIGMAANVFDQSNGVNNAYAVYELSLSVDGKQLFQSRVDSFSYAETGQMFLDRIYSILKKQDEGYQRMYIADGNTLPFYTTSSSKGILNLAPGKHEVTIQATDYFGNSSSASLTLWVKAQNGKARNWTENRVMNQLLPFPSPHDWDWFNNWFTISEQHFQQLTLALKDSSRLFKHKNGIAVNLQNRDHLFASIPDMGPMNLRRVPPQSSTFVTSAVNESFALFPPKTFHDTVSVGMSVKTYTPDSLTVDLIPDTYPLQGDYTFYAGRDSALVDTTKLSFYKLDRYDEEEKWELVPTTFSKKYMIGQAESLGTFVSMRDTTAPSLTNPRVRQRPDEKWVLLIDVNENLSGIDYNRTRISVNGVRGIAEFEPEDDRFVYYHPDFKPSNPMTIEISAYDKMGNSVDETFVLDGQ